MAVAYQIVGKGLQSYITVSEIIKAQKIGPNANGKGIIAASYDGLSTGFDWEYFARLHVGATAWYLFAERRYNPYWGTRTGPVPVVKASGKVDYLEVSPRDTVVLTLGLDPGIDAGKPADWWLVIGSEHLLYQDELFPLQDVELLSVSGLPDGGLFHIHFGVDMKMDGALTFDRLYFDSMTVKVMK